MAKSNTVHCGLADGVLAYKEAQDQITDQPTSINRNMKKYFFQQISGKHTDNK